MVGYNILGSGAVATYYTIAGASLNGHMGVQTSWQRHIGKSHALLHCCSGQVQCKWLMHKSKGICIYYVWTCMFLVTHPRLACYCTVNRTVVLCCACWYIIGAWCSVHCWLLGHILVLGTVLCLLVYYWGTLALVTRRTEGDGTSVRAKPPPNGLQRSKQPLLENSDGSSLRHGALTLIHCSQFLIFTQPIWELNAEADLCWFMLSTQR